MSSPSRSLLDTLAFDGLMPPRVESAGRGESMWGRDLTTEKGNSASALTEVLGPTGFACLVIVASRMKLVSR